MILKKIHNLNKLLLDGNTKKKARRRAYEKMMEEKKKGEELTASMKEICKAVDRIMEALTYVKGGDADPGQDGEQGTGNRG